MSKNGGNVGSDGKVTVEDGAGLIGGGGWLVVVIGAILTASGLLLVVSIGRTEVCVLDGACVVDWRSCVPVPWDCGESLSTG